jgi:hypothetical protein
LHEGVVGPPFAALATFEGSGRGDFSAIRSK